jgi:uncharacterized protein (TIGR00251 family)
MKLELKVIPASSRDSVVGWLGNALKIKVRAPAEKGRANQSVENLLTKTLGLPRGVVAITAGHTSSSKTVEITGLDRGELDNRLAAAGIS